MPRKHRRRSRRSRNTSRRTFLLKAGVLGVGAVSLGQYVQSTGAFDLVTASRGVDASVASEGNGLVGIVGQGDVQKNQREAMVKFTNNSPDTVTITVSLDNPADGTLYDNEGGSGSSVTFSLPSGNLQYIDINADIQGVVPYSVSVTSASLSLNTTGSVEAVGGNANDFVRISNLQDLQANSDDQNNWTLGKIQIQDRDGDDDLDRVEYEINDSTGTLRASRTVQISGKQYQDQDLTFNPHDSSYDLPEGEKYTLTATGYDVDGNSSSDTVTATSVGTGGPGGGGGCIIGSNNNPSALQFSDLQNFTAKKGADRWTIGQVQVQDADGDNDLNKLKFEITDSGGSVRATESIAISGQQYQDQNLKINPDPSYDVPNGETYTLTATVCDADGNSNTKTRQSTA